MITLENVNAKYNDETYPIFPFIAQDKVTILKKGLYRKLNANFRGVTAVFDKEAGEYKFPLYGMYNIEQDMVIVPPGTELTEGRNSMIATCLSNGFIKSATPPHFKPYYFSPASMEAKVAIMNKLDSIPTKSAPVANY